ncbi:hypothetical protein KPA07_06230 [Corynebacterium aurimucosum]|uniref:hypothetical protein n=1 Tax=Corynebacterium aurimucosum TaxID=169292 RepID=UPI001C0EB4CC|nr:hypothetical protein [Corynebacterium aurimucosum]MBU5654509.1 hypothetical protein [Corynebacterium aurimucosum]
MEILQIPAHPALLLSAAHNDMITLDTLEELLIRTINPCMFRDLQTRLDEECEDLAPDDALRHRVATILLCFNAAVKMNVGAGSVAEFKAREYDMEIGVRAVRLYDADEDGNSYPFVAYYLPKDLQPLGDPAYTWSADDAKRMEKFMWARGWCVHGAATRDPQVHVREV